MSPKTAEALEAIKNDTSETIAPSLYSYSFGRAAAAAAFRIAKRDGLIEVAYTSCAGTPVYRKPARPAGAAVH